jgi:ribosome-associated translation inhibitor RaiA
VFIPKSKKQVVKVQAEELRECIDLATDKIMRAVKRSRNRRRDKIRHSGEFKAATRPDDDDGDDTQPAP